MYIVNDTKLDCIYILEYIRINNFEVKYHVNYNISAISLNTYVTESICTQLNM